MRILAGALLHGAEAAACPGGCDGDGQVAINEAVKCASSDTGAAVDG